MGGLLVIWRCMEKCVKLGRSYDRVLQSAQVSVRECEVFGVECDRR